MDQVKRASFLIFFLEVCTLKAKLKCADAAKLVKRAARIAATVTSVPALSCIKLSANEKEQTVRITAYNLETGIVATLDADVEEPGEVCVKANLLSSILSRLEGDELRVSSTSNAIRIQCDEALFTLSLDVDAGDFPMLPLDAEAVSSVKVDPEALADSLDGVLFSTGDDPFRPALLGVNVNIGVGYISLTASDTKRMAQRFLDVEDSATMNIVAPVAAAVLEEAVAFCKKAKEPVTLSLTEGHIRLDIGNVLMVGRRLEGTFPNLPVGTHQAIRGLVKTDEFLASAYRAEVVSGPEKKVRVKIDIFESHLDITAATQIGVVNDRIDACVASDNLEDETRAIASVSVNSGFLLDVLKHCTSENLQVCWNGAGSPLQFTPEYSEGENPKSRYVYLLAPVRNKS